MVSGHFDGFHGGHLDYLEQAAEYGDIICIVSSDKQLLMKKGKIHMHEDERLRVVETMLKGIGCEHSAFINIWDTETPTIADALFCLNPSILFRGYDKTLDTMPGDERKVCEWLGVKVIHAKNRIGERHSTEIFK